MSVRLESQELITLAGQIDAVATRIRRDHALGREWYDLTGARDHLIEVALERRQLDASLEPRPPGAG